MEDSTNSVERRICPEISTEVKKLADEMELTMTQSLIAASAIQDSAESDELARLEEMVDNQLESAGVSPQSLEPDENKISASEWRSRDDKHRFRILIPESLISLMEENATNHRLQGVWLENALRKYLESPYSSRFERIETKRQVLELVQGGSVPSDERTDVLGRILHGEVFSEVYSILEGDGERVVRENDAADVDVEDWRDESITVVVDNIERPGELRYTPSARRKAVLAFCREVDGGVGPGLVEAMVDRATEDYDTDNTPEQLKEDIWEYIEQDDLINSYVPETDDGEESWVSTTSTDETEQQEPDWHKIADRHHHNKQHEDVYKAKINQVCEAENIDENELLKEVSDINTQFNSSNVSEKADIVSNLIDRYPKHF
jgi:hypothetical protein